MWSNQPIRVQVLDLTLVVALFWIYFKSFGNVRSVGAEVPVDYEGIFGDFINLKILFRLSILEVLK